MNALEVPKMNAGMSSSSGTGKELVATQGKKPQTQGVCSLLKEITFNSKSNQMSEMLISKAQIFHQLFNR